MQRWSHHVAHACGKNRILKLFSREKQIYATATKPPEIAAHTTNKQIHLNVYRMCDWMHNWLDKMLAFMIMAHF